MEGCQGMAMPLESLHRTRYVNWRGFSGGLDQDYYLLGLNQLLNGFFD
jgi:hypothetical protein